MNNEMKTVVSFVIGAGVAIGLIVARDNLRKKIERAKAAEEALQLELELEESE